VENKDDNTWLKTLLTKLVENAPAIIVLMIVAYLQQQQIYALISECITRTVR